LIQNVTVVHVWVKLTDGLSLARKLRSGLTALKLKAGMTATCSFLIAKKNNVIRVPRVAVKERLPERRAASGKATGNVTAAGPRGNGAADGGNRGTRGGGKREGGARKQENKTYYVQVMDKRGKPQERIVKPGLFGIDYVEILSGLAEGETVVVAAYDPSAGGPGGGRPGGGASSQGRMMRTLR
jgi:HlyD family secretion protein